MWVCTKGCKITEVIADLPKEVDEFGEMNVMVDAKTGKATNHYWDGITGVVDEHATLAEECETPMCPECHSECDWYPNTPINVRRQRFMPGGIPKKIRCYDSGPDGAIDRYTVVFTGNYTHMTGGEFMYLGMNAAPFHPQGFGQHGSSRERIDRPRYSHLGKPIKFTDLPEDCQKAVLQDYTDLWGIGRRLLGFYSRFGYSIHETDHDGRLHGEEPLYRAGNSPCDSTLVVPLDRPHESLGTLRKWCVQTGKELAKEHGIPWAGCQREEDNDPYID